MYEVGRRFLFFINKIENNTIHITQILQNQSDSLGARLDNGGSTNCGGTLTSAAASAAVSFFDAASNATSNASANESLANFYDSSGAANYIVVVVLVYGFAIIFFIGSQVRSTKKFSDEVDGVNAEKILRSMETEIFTKEVLDKEHREKAWKIYLSKPSGTSPNHSRRSSTASQNKQTSAYETPPGLKQIDMTAVESIEKKLRLLNKVQSNYRLAENKEAEIETVKEVLKPTKTKTKLSPSSPSRLIKYTNKLKNSLKKSKTQSDEKPSHLSKLLKHPPMIVLQTDDEGLYKLKESRKTTSAADADDRGDQEDRLSATSISRYSVGSCYSIDACEISEKITTV